MQIATKGIVIRERSVNDDRLVTLLTRDHGVINAFARGAKRLKGKLTSSTELFCYSRLVLFEGRDSYTVNAAECDASFFELRKDLDKIALASYIAELCCELAPKEEEAEEYLRLLLNTLHFLKTGQRDGAQLKAIFELRLLTMAGFMPDLVGCRGCGAHEGRLLFLPSSGELACLSCRAKDPPESIEETIELPPPVLAAMRHILYSDLERLFSFHLTEGNLRLLAHVSERYLLCQMGRSYKALEFYHSLAAL